MSPADIERASTWLIEIVETIMEGVKWRLEGDEHHASGQGGLTINTRKGCWFSHSAGKGGWNAISLVTFLKTCDSSTATQWVVAFLRAHPGTGSTVPGDSDDEREIENAALAQEIV